MTIARGIDLPEAEIYRRYPVKELAVFGSAVQGVFQPLLAKHSKSFSLVDAISVGVDRMQRNFEPMRKQVETWRQAELSNVTAKLIIYQAFIEGELDVPKHLARRVHDCYFEPRYDEFKPRTLWSLSNAFTSAFKELEPIPQLRATAKLGGFPEARFKQRSDRAGRIGLHGVLLPVAHPKSSPADDVRTPDTSNRAASRGLRMLTCDRRKLKSSAVSLAPRALHDRNRRSSTADQVTTLDFVREP